MELTETVRLATTGDREFNLNRSNFGSQASRLQVLKASGSHGVSELDSQWEYAHWNWRELATGKSTDTAPPGQILIHASVTTGRTTGLSIIFNGDQFLQAAKEAGAEIRVQ